MCHSNSGPMGRRPKKKKRVITPQQKSTAKMCSRKVFQQMTLFESIGSNMPTACNPTPSIQASGDPISDKEDGIIRFAFQNINGTSLQENLDMMPEVATIGALQLDVAAFTETNIHWSHQN